MFKSWSRRLLAASSFSMICVAPAFAQDPPGVLWEMTSQMSMEGMPMSPPPVTMQICTAREWTKAPPGGDKSCVSANFQRTADKASWDMQCSGRMPMSGHGEITFAGGDSYSGVIDAAAEGMAIRIKLSGKKLGTCDKPLG
jgi:hypothetical protein